MNPVIVASLVGGALAVDHRSSLGLMVSQPLCGGLITGMFLGSPAEGLLAGGLFQMIFLGHVPVRGERIPDLPVAGIAAAALYILVNREVGADPALRGAVLLLSLLVAILVALLGHLFYRWWEGVAALVVQPAVRDAREGRSLHVSAIHLSLLLLHFAYAFGTLFVVIAAGRLLLSRGAVILAGISGETFGSLVVLVPFIGVGGLLRLHFIRTRIFWFGAGFLVSYVFILVRG
ncbi:MAG TPA: PTS sugar transporter subunit IIC [Patescibacteria group bacterium]|nr:PTS sugar transporter subunit IIC [Patescibacteria group bacterium]